MAQMTSGAYIRSLREKVGLTEEALAEKIGVSVTAVEKWESDESFPDEANLLPLCEILGSTAQELRDAKPALTSEEVLELKRIANAKSRNMGLAAFGGGVLLLVIRFTLLTAKNVLVNALAGLTVGFSVALMILGLVWFFAGITGKAQDE